MKREIKAVIKDFSDYLSSSYKNYQEFDCFERDGFIVVVSPQKMDLPVEYEKWPVIKITQPVEPL